VRDTVRGRATRALRSESTALPATRHGRSRFPPALPLILFLGVGLRFVLYTRGYGSPQRFLETDSSVYLSIGRRFFEAVLQNRHKYIDVTILRTPGYPAFIAAARAVHASIRFLVAVQILLAVPIILATYYVTLRLFGRGAAVVAAVFVAIDPASIIYSNYVLTETLFTLLILVAVHYWLRLFSQRSAGLAVAVGLLFGTSALIRPISLYILVCLLPVTLLFMRAPWGRRMMVVAIIALAFIVPTGGWALRNRAVTGQLIFSSIEGKNLLRYRGAGALAFEEGVSEHTARLELGARELAALKGRTDQATRGRVDTKLGVQVLRAHLVGTAVVTAQGAGRILVGPARTSLALVAWGVPKKHGALAKSVDIGQLAILVSMLSLAGLGMAMTVTTRVSRTRRLGVVVLGSLIAYFLIVSSGPEADSRFRVAITPYLSALAGVGFEYANSAVTKWRSGSHAMRHRQLERA
jgi:4-amino-4-deoxy-L-arabinose transferase-like glycosyltransferase